MKEIVSSDTSAALCFVQYEGEAAVSAILERRCGLRLEQLEIYATFPTFVCNTPVGKLTIADFGKGTFYHVLSVDFAFPDDVPSGLAATKSERAFLPALFAIRASEARDRIDLLPLDHLTLDVVRALAPHEELRFLLGQAFSARRVKVLLRAHSSTSALTRWMANGLDDLAGLSSDVICARYDIDPTNTHPSVTALRYIFTRRWLSRPLHHLIRRWCQHLWQGQFEPQDRPQFGDRSTPLSGQRMSCDLF